MTFYDISVNKYNKYVDQFVNWTSESGISPNFAITANKYHRRKPLILAMMLEYAIVAGRPDIISHLLDIGANPHHIDPDNNIHELLSDGDIDSKTIKKMENVFAKWKFRVNLHDDSADII